MTISGPAVPVFCMYLVAAERQGADLSKLDGTLQTDIFKEYIAQKEWLFDPEPHLRLIGDLMEYCARRDPAVQAAVGLRLPHPRGRLDRRAGAGVHAGRRLRLRRAGPVPRAGRQRVRARAELLLRRARRLLRGDRQVPRRPPDLGPLAARRLRRDQREGAVAAVPHPDRRGLADRAAAGQQRGTHRGRGAGRGARRHQLAAHQRARRDPGAAHRRVGRDRPAHPAGADGGDRRDQRGRPARRLLVRRGAHRPDRGRGGGDLRPDPRRWATDGTITSGILRGIEDGWFTAAIAESAFVYQQALEKGDKKIVGVNCHTGTVAKELEILRVSHEVELEQKARAGRAQGRAATTPRSTRGAARGWSRSPAPTRT